MSCCGWIYNLFRKTPEKSDPPLSPAKHAQNIRNAIPAACQTIKGLQDLKVVISRYTTEDPELFNAINRTLPLTAPSSIGDFDLLGQICDMIADHTERAKILKTLEWANY
ncbi:hypothetical protein CER19_02570 [Pseudomonas sp. GL93]|uniref:hypothetical protein n=1 Tax=unclassified Pseudomonas TaxID=196821 RepID=UPI000E32450E|nr:MULTISPECIES: hypothetical protein [unclassified Pseudomonas]RFD33863.1 hypothetical protein CER19_02570 [Pseudomonas sp. GL93]